MNEHTLSHSTNYPSKTAPEAGSSDPQEPADTLRHEQLLHETIAAQKISGETNAGKTIPASEALARKVAETRKPE